MLITLDHKRKFPIFIQIIKLYVKLYEKNVKISNNRTFSKKIKKRDIIHGDHYWVYTP